jgi:hypothetical protein
MKNKHTPPPTKGGGEDFSWLGCCQKYLMCSLWTFVKSINNIIYIHITYRRDKGREKEA